MGITAPYLSSVLSGKYPLTESLLHLFIEQFQIDPNKINISLNNVNNELTENSVIYNKELISYIKLLPISAIAGPIKDFDMANNPDSERMISPVKDADLAITYGSRLFDGFPLPNTTLRDSYYTANLTFCIMCVTDDNSVFILKQDITYRFTDNLVPHCVKSHSGILIHFTISIILSVAVPHLGTVTCLTCFLPNRMKRNL